MLGSLAVSAASAVLFVWHERRTVAPLMDFALLRHRNYLGASISQMLAGMAEIGLGVIFPLLLILNLGSTPTSSPQACTSTPSTPSRPPSTATRWRSPRSPSSR